MRAGGISHLIVNPVPKPTIVGPVPSCVSYVPEYDVRTTCRQVLETVPARDIACVSMIAPTCEHVISGRQLTAILTGGYGQRTNAPLHGQEEGIEVLSSAEVAYPPTTGPYPGQPMSAYAIQPTTSDSEASGMQKLRIDMHTLIQN